MCAKNLRFPVAAALLALPGFFATGLIAHAATAQHPGAAAVIVETMGLIHNRTFSVTVTNTTTGEVGCHNATTQTSEPGRCEQPPH